MPDQRPIGILSGSLAGLLLGGLAGGTAGAVTTKQRERETPAELQKRRLANVLAGSLLGGGAGASFGAAPGMFERIGNPPSGIQQAAKWVGVGPSALAGYGIGNMLSASKTRATAIAALTEKAMQDYAKQHAQQGNVLSGAVAKMRTLASGGKSRAITKAEKAAMNVFNAAIGRTLGLDALKEFATKYKPGTVGFPSEAEAARMVRNMYTQRLSPFGRWSKTFVNKDLARAIPVPPGTTSRYGTRPTRAGGWGAAIGGLAPLLLPHGIKLLTDIQED